jgi:hypothetical protein
VSRGVHSAQEVPADVEAVFALLSSQEWAQRRAQELHDGSELVRRESAADGGVVLVTSRELPAGAPGFLERFLPKDGRVTQTEEWGPPSGPSRVGTWRVELPGAPARLGGTMRLEPASAGSRYVVEGEVSVKVPVVGGRAEAFVAAMLEKLAGKEGDLLRRALTG